MEFTYYGGNCITLSTKNVLLLIDPLVKSYGIKLPKMYPDVVLFTAESGDTKEFSSIFTITSSGEYEIKGVFIQGVAARLHTQQEGKILDSIIYLISQGDLRVMVVGNITGVLNEEQLEVLGNVDVLVVPVGGNGLTLDGIAAAQLVNQVEPSYVIPVHYNDGQTKYPVLQAGLDPFTHEMGVQLEEEVVKFKLSSKPTGEGTNLVVLKDQALKR